MKSVESKDGSKITYENLGDGPPVILVDGAMGSLAAGFSKHMAELLAPDFTVIMYDRRGRGESTNTQPFAVAREIEDIEALIDAAGGKAYVYGISSGASLALEAAAKLGYKVPKLALYEAPYDEADGAKEAWHEYTSKLKELVDKGDRAGAAELFMRFVGTPEEMIAGVKQSPMWPAFEAVAPTLPYDAAAMGKDRKVPVDRAAEVEAHTLVLDGGNSAQYMPFMQVSADKLADAMPHAERRTIAGQGHDVDPKALAPVLKEFFAS